MIVMVMMDRQQSLTTLCGTVPRNFARSASQRVIRRSRIFGPVQMTTDTALAVTKVRRRRPRIPLFSFRLTRTVLRERLMAQFYFVNITSSLCLICITNSKSYLFMAHLAWRSTRGGKPQDFVHTAECRAGVQWPRQYYRRHDYSTAVPLEDTPDYITISHRSRSLIMAPESETVD